MNTNKNGTIIFFIFSSSLITTINSKKIQCHCKITNFIRLQSTFIKFFFNLLFQKLSAIRSEKLTSVFAHPGNLVWTDLWTNKCLPLSNSQNGNIK